MNQPSNQAEPSKGFMSSPLFKVMLVVLFIALGGYYMFRYSSKQDSAPADGSEESTTELEVTEALAEPEAPLEAGRSVIESGTTYEYRETGNTYTLIDEGGPGPYEFTCTSIAKVTTSTALASQGSSSYAANNMTDMVESTAWSEGSEGYGIGDWIEFTITDAYKKWGYTQDDFVPNHILGGFVIQTGYAKSPAAWKKNSRPIKLQTYLNGEPLYIIQLRDTPDFQSFSIFPEQSDARLKEGDVIRFEILEVVQGTSGKDKDALISEFHIEGSCG